MNRTLIYGLILAVCMAILGITGAEAEGKPINLTAADCAAPDARCYP